MHADDSTHRFTFSTLQDLARSTGISPSVLRRAAKAGRLRFVQPSGPRGKIYLDVADVERAFGGASRRTELSA